MRHEHTKPIRLTDERQEADLSVPKAPWQPPKLTFVEPKVEKHGDLHEVTGQSNGFFGTQFP
jgi:hypothetical protein